MPMFKDAEGGEWKLSLTIHNLETLRDEFGVDLANAYQNDAAMQIDSDVILLVKVLHTLCDSQRRERNISDERFGELLVGDAIDRAREALVEALMLFFPASKRQLLQKQLEKQNRVWTEVVQGIEEMTTPEELSALVRKSLLEARASLTKAAMQPAEDPSTSGPPSTTAPASSA